MDKKKEPAPITFLHAEKCESVVLNQQTGFAQEVDTFNTASGDGDTV